MDLSNELLDIPLSRLFFNEGFNITGYECARILDITERYLFDNLKPSFNYVKANKGDTACFTEFYQLTNAVAIEEQLSELRAKYITNNDAYRKFLAKKRIFINRDSFKEFLRNDLKLVIEYKRLDIDKEQIPVNVSKGEVRHIIANMPRVANTPLMQQLPEETLDKLVNGELRLYSPKSLKDRVAVGGLTVYDAQLYRWIDSRANITKLALSTVSNQAPVIRYLLNASEFEYFQDFDAYSIDSKCYYEGIEDDILDKVYKLSEEKKKEAK